MKKAYDKRNEVIHNKDNHGSYGKLLLDVKWKEFRKIIIQRDNHKCTICDCVSDLQVHHKQYHFSETSRTFKKPWEYNTSLLITICKKCHDFGHRKYKVPTKYIK